ncbi:uncharacterized protein V5649_013668 [Rhynchonycteris naso]
MGERQRQGAEDIEQSAVELLPRNPYCSNDRSHCGCRLSHGAYQSQWVTKKPWSLWKTFLVCLLACLIATTLVVLVLYYVHFGKPTVGTTIIIHADGKSSHVACIPGSVPSPAPSTLPGAQSTLPSTLVANQSSPTTVPPPTMQTTKPAAEDHEVFIED